MDWIPRENDLYPIAMSFPYIYQTFFKVLSFFEILFVDDYSDVRFKGSLKIGVK